VVYLNRFQLDTCGLICPLPVIRTQDRIRELNDGDELVVRASDPGALHDIPAWCRVHGHAVLQTRHEQDKIVIHILVRRP